ncbi:hypothetical protein ACIBEJ_00345 [Nonomuraea sp. NPDC050790]|uniref:hypothetical protein n=1 Tax=Nonomuraea sp. NPDC050790 TaxID=3364371 RepID=UPI0037B04B2B
MASTDWLCFSGVEVANAARVHAYAQAGLAPAHASVRDCGCAGLATILGDDPYTLPAGDEAPWYDPAETSSGDFAGFLVLDVEGLDSAPVSRPVTNRLGEGAVIGRRRYGPRTITVTGVLVGRTACAVDYGQRWLASVLQGALACGPGACSGDDLEYMTCCPTEAAAEGQCCPGPCTTMTCGQGVFRTLRDVALLSEPTVQQRIGGCGCCPGELRQIQFQLVAGRPHALRPAVTVAEAVPWPPETPDDECVRWSTDPACLDEAGECAAQLPQPCPLDPNCPPPDLPELPLPNNPCLCEPFTRRQVCVAIPESSAPIWADLVPLLEIYSGSDILRNIRIRFYPNPFGVPYEELDPCAWCSEINISYLPEGARLTMDSTRRTIYVQCPGRADTPAEQIVSGPEGRPLSWPVLECGIPYLACISADSTTIATDATVTVRTIVREI